MRKIQYKKVRNIMDDCIALSAKGLWCLFCGPDCKNRLKHRDFNFEVEIDIRPKGNKFWNWKEIKKILTLAK